MSNSAASLLLAVGWGAFAVVIGLSGGDNNFQLLISNIFVATSFIARKDK